MSFNLYHVDASYSVNIIHQINVNFEFFNRLGVYFYNIHTFDIYMYIFVLDVFQLSVDKKIAEYLIQ